MKLRRFGHITWLVCATLISHAYAQAQGTTPQNVTEAFASGVTACVKAVSSAQSVGALPAADRLGITPANQNEPSMMRFTPGRPAFDVGPAKGIVGLTEPADLQCEVIGYGPRVLHTYAATKARITAAFPALRVTRTERTFEDYIAEYEVTAPNGAKIRIFLMGGEPGMGSRRFRFPMFTATVSIAP